MNDLKFTLISHDTNDSAGSHHGFVNSQIQAYLDGVEVGYIKVTNLPKDIFESNCPDVWHYMNKWQGWHLDFTKSEEELNDQILNYMGCYHSFKHESKDRKFQIVKKNGEDNYQETMNKTRDFFVDKPFVCYVEVFKDYRGQGIADELYKEASLFVQSQGYELYSDTNQTSAATKVWMRFKDNGLAVSIGTNRFKYIG